MLLKVCVDGGLYVVARLGRVDHRDRSDASTRWHLQPCPRVLSHSPHVLHTPLHINHAFNLLVFGARRVIVERLRWYDHGEATRTHLYYHCACHFFSLFPFN